MNGNAAAVLGPMGTAALGYVDQGMHVFRLVPNTKRPVEEHGHLDATNDRAEVVRRWTETPDANIGVALAPSGVLAVDIDGDPAALFDAVQDKVGVLPPTRIHITGSGGAHLLYSVNAAENLQRRIHPYGDDPPVDLLGGGYAIVPPSRVDGRPYSVHSDAPIAVAPPALVDLVRRNGNPPMGLSSVPSVARTIGDADLIPEGTRDHTLFRIAAQFAEQGLRDDALEAALLEVNRRRCVPSCPEADVIEKARNAQRNVERYGKLDRPEKVRTGGLPVPPSRRESDDAAVVDEPRPLGLEELEALPPPSWLVHELIPGGALGMLYGPPGSGKTFVAIAGALAIGTGTPFVGLAVPERRAVLYAAGEGHAGMAVRLRAAMSASQRQGIGLLRVLPTSLDLFSPAGIDRAKRAIDRMPDKPALIVADTLARAMAGADENSARDMGIVISNCDELRRYADGATVLLVHHTGKSGEVERGSSALRGAVDFALKLTEDGAGLRLEVDKQKDAKEHDPISLHLREAGESLAIGLGKRWDQWSPQSALILRVVSESFGTDQVSTSNLMAATDLPKSTFFRALKPLVDAGVLAREDVGRATYYRTVGFGRADKSQSVPTGPRDLPAIGLTHPPPLGGETSREETPTPLSINPFMTL